MGCILSKKQKTSPNYTRVVHANGRVEDFYYPLTAGEVTGKPPKQFLCTQAQLMSGYLKPLKADTRLETNHVYFMLSYSTIQSEYSPMDIAMTAKRLAKLAKTSRPSSPSSDRSMPCGSINELESPCRSPGQMGDQSSSLVEFGKAGSCYRSRSWKPILDTIKESSFDR